MPAGTRIDPYGQFNFTIEIDGVTRAGFSEVSGLTTDTNVIEYRDHMLVFQQVRHQVESGAQWRGGRDSRKAFERLVQGALERAHELQQLNLAAFRPAAVRGGSHGCCRAPRCGRQPRAGDLGPVRCAG